MPFSIRNSKVPGLCHTCKHAHIRSFDTGKQEVICGRLDVNALMPRPVVECTMYEEKGTMDEWDMEKIAFVLETKKGKPIGFLSPTEYKEKYPKGEE